MKLITYSLLMTTVALLGASCKQPSYQEGEYTARVLHFLVSDDEVAIEHLIGVTTCPQNFPVLRVEAPVGTEWMIDPDTKPDWYQMVGYEQNKGVIQEEVTELQPQFNCNIQDYSTHEEKARVSFNAYDEAGELFATKYVDYKVNLKAKSDQ